MIPLIEANRSAIVDLCKQYGVRKLALFGSAAKGTFDPKTSDLDFVLEFSDYGSGVGQRFMSFALDMEDLLGRPVDLLFESVIKDPDLRFEVLETQELVYDEATSVEAVA